MRTEVDRSWRSLHIFLHDYTKQEVFLLETLEPYLNSISERFSGWFYIRYWELGPHIRVRFLNIDDEVFEEAKQAISDSLYEYRKVSPIVFAPATSGTFSSPQEDWIENASVVEMEYVPEYDRYGGVNAIAHSEDFFTFASGLAINITRFTEQDLNKRILLLTDLLLVGGHRIAETKKDVSKFFKRHSIFWESILGEGAPEDSLIEKIHCSVNDRVKLLYDNVTERQLSPMLSDWLGAIDNLIDELKSLEGTGKITYARPNDESDVGESEQNCGYIIASQLHMMANRLGVSPYYECAISKAISRSLC